MVSSTPRPHFTPGKEPVSILQEAGWAPGPVWTGGKSRPHRDSIPDRPARSQSLYRLSYPAHNSILIIWHKAWEDEEEDVSIYWMTFTGWPSRKDRIMEIERGTNKSHSVEKSLWKKIVSLLKQPNSPHTIHRNTKDTKVQLKCDGTRWSTEGEVKWKLANAVDSQYPSHYLGKWCTQHYYR